MTEMDERAVRDWNTGTLHGLREALAIVQKAQSLTQAISQIDETIEQRARELESFAREGSETER